MKNEQECEHCNGTGEGIIDACVCTYCHGSGVVIKQPKPNPLTPDKNFEEYYL